MKYILILTILVSTLVGCSDIQDDIKQYLNEGETIYVGKLEVIDVHPGENRIMIEGVMPYGITQTKCVFTWSTPSGEKTSKEFEITRGDQYEIFNFVLEPLEEGQHDFEVTTLDSKGNSSIIVNIGGYSYGETYQSTLTNRGISSVGVSSEEETVAEISWLPINNEQFTGCEIEYEKTDGVKGYILAEIGEEKTLLPDYKPGSVAKWRSLYMPDPLAIDIFKTEWEEIELP